MPKYESGDSPRVGDYLLPKWTDEGHTTFVHHRESNAGPGSRGGSIHELMPTYPVVSIPFYDQLYPRDPSEYVPLTHFLQRQKEPERMLTKKLDGVHVIDRAIITGNLEANDNQGWGCFKLNWYGVRYHIITGWHEKGYPVLISGWPVLKDEERAKQSDHWTEPQLNSIQWLNKSYHDNKPRGNYPRSRREGDWDEYLKWSKNHTDGGLIHS